MSVADIIVLVVLVLGGLVGASKGFMKSVMGLAAIVVAALIAWLLGSEVAKLISSIPSGDGTLLDALADKISASLAQKGGALTTAPVGGYTADNVTTILQLAGVPSILIGVIANPLSVALTPYGSASMAEVLGPILSNIVFTASAFLFVFVLVYAVFLVVSKKINKMIENVVILKNVDVLLGLLLGIIKSVLGVWVLLALLGAINFLPAIDGLISSSTILSWLVNNNPVSLMIASGLNIEEAINSFISGIA